MKKLEIFSKNHPKKLILMSIGILLVIAGVIAGAISVKNIVSDGTNTNKSDYNIKNDPENGKYSTRIWSDDGVELWAKNEEANKGGDNEPLKLVSGKDEIYFTGSFIFHVGSRTRYYNVDVTGDGKKDHILILPTIGGTGVRGEEIHVFEGKKCKEIPTEDPLEYLSSLITFSSDDDNYYASFNGQTKKYRKDLFYSYGTDLQLDTPLLECEYFEYNVNETKEGTADISASFLVSVSKANLDGIAVCDANFSYSKKSLVCESFDFSGPRGMYETNSEKWFVRTYGSQIILTSDEKRYVISPENFSEDESRLAPAFITGDETYCVLTYYDSSYGDNDTAMMCATVVYLKSGNIKELYADQLADILSYHELTEKDISEYISKDKSRLTHTLEVKETDSSSLLIYSKITSDDAKLELCGHYIAAPYHMYYYDEYIVDSTDMGDYHYEPEMPNELKNIDDVPPYVANAAIAFLNKDTKALEDLLGCRDGVLRQYEDFEFGKYSFSYKDNSLEMKVEIKKSSLKAVPPGEHTVSFTSGRWGSVSMSGIGAHSYYNKDNGVEGLAEIYTSCWMEGIPSPYTELRVIESINSAKSSDYNSLKNDLLKYLKNCRNNISTPAEYKQAAKDIFGLNDLNIPDDMINDDGTVQLWGHGGFIRMYHILSETKENNIITVKVQMYADFSRTVESHVYEFKYEDHGDHLKIVSIEITEKSEYEPEDRYVA